MAAIGVIFLFLNSWILLLKGIYVTVVINVFSISPVLHIVHVECVGCVRAFLKTTQAISSTSLPGFETCKLFVWVGK